MKTVLVTGAAGFVGKNLCATLEQDKGLKLLKFDRSSSATELKEFVVQADFIFHLAGVNRPKNDAEFDSGNRGLTEAMLGFLSASGRETPLLLASSIQVERDNAYGKSKKAAEDAVFAWAKATGASVYVYRLPNIFGKWCRPNYNSVVATFCHNIARDQEIVINDPASELALVYIDDVVAEFKKALAGELPAPSGAFYEIPRVFKTTVGAIAEKLRAFRASGETLIMPSLEQPLDQFLYATYVSYLPENAFDHRLEMKRDARGWLSEFLKSEQSGQVYVARTKPGAVRGEHWHNTKVEKFLVIEGQADIKFRRLGSDEVITYKVTGEELRVVDVPTGYVHSFVNTGKSDMLAVIWASKIFEPERPDTYFEKVEE